jgi:hypothetical protein
MVTFSKPNILSQTLSGFVWIYIHTTLVEQCINFFWLVQTFKQGQQDIYHGKMPKDGLLYRGNQLEAIARRAR